MSDTAGLQIIIVSGPEDAPRATLGFSVAAAAAACGTPVTLFLAMNGTRWALRSEGNQSAVPGFQPIAQLLDLILAGGGRVEVCSNCLQGLCSDSAVCGPRSDHRPGVVPGGMAALAVRMAKASTVTF